MLPDFIIKDINKDKLYDFLRDMEFNRLLSQAISFYGEPTNKDFNEKTVIKKNNKINTKTYKTISEEKQLDELIKKLDEKSVIAVDTETSSLIHKKQILWVYQYVMRPTRHFIFQ
jgi:DNA polymerase-1